MRPNLFFPTDTSYQHNYFALEKIKVDFRMSEPGIISKSKGFFPSGLNFKDSG